MPPHFFGRVHLSTYINFFVFFFSTSSVHRREQSLADRMTARNTAIHHFHQLLLYLLDGSS